ncbi:hypothetical protein H2198_004379 [Neophaeococcomyces mojaviensis]|uniref:Uncharacterized protein n=1 Tax=Neophaeococcomyces mojaviensis TaxID=3383035 RepID=A0ACC3A8U7_9EURO|nr:hypothetical protein H2198_004379 [Knufia sp. JES_112]
MATETAPPKFPTPPPKLQDDTLDPTLTALSTLSLLNVRLSRLEFLLTGTTTTQDGLSQPSVLLRDISRNKHNDIPSQLHTLEIRLANLKRMDGLSGSLVRMVDSLRREYPELFPQTATRRAVASEKRAQEQPISTSELSHQANEILSHASLYTSTSSRLQTLQTLRIPPASQSAILIEQAPRMAKLRERQEELNGQISDLTTRSAKVLEWWVDVGVQGMGELWDDWEDRVAVCERFVKVHERKAKEERGEVG